MNQTHLTDYLELHAAQTPNKAALVCSDKTLSWLELNTLVDAVSAHLFSKLGRQSSQQIVGLLLPNGWQFVVAYLATLKLGHIGMPLDATFKQIEVEAVIGQIPPELIITNSYYAPLLSENDDITEIFDEISLNANMHSRVQTLRLDAKQQIASLVFTSGTTGKPKAAPYTHRNHIWNIEVCSKLWNWDADDTLLISLQLSHWYGLVMGLSGILYHGNTLYLHDWFDEHKTLETLASGNITMFTHISSVYMKLLDVQGDYDISRVRLCISGGSALPPSIWNKFKVRFGQEILECYGSSETGRIASNLLNQRIPGSPGRIIEGVDFKLSSHNEVLIKSEGVFPGYFNNPKATKDSLTADGYWRTGDIGELDSGRVILKGRSQERIRRYGYTISPRDVEWALHKNQAIKEAYVMGIQATDGSNDKLVYFIKSTLDEATITAYCKTSLPFAWRPDKVILVASIPKTRNGKPQVHKLKQLAHIA